MIIEPPAATKKMTPPACDPRSSSTTATMAKTAAAQNISSCLVEVCTERRFRRRSKRSSLHTRLYSDCRRRPASAATSGERISINSTLRAAGQRPA